MRLRRIVIFAFLFLWSLSGLSQSRKDKVEALRIAYINKQVGLTPAEAEKFWPVYNEYHDRIRVARKELRQLVRRYSDQLDEEAMKELYRKEQEARSEEAEVHSTFSERIRKLIGYKKYLKLRFAEENFRRELLRTLRESGQEE